jgi:hypothetical protein
MQRCQTNKRALIETKISTETFIIHGYEHNVSRRTVYHTTNIARRANHEKLPSRHYITTEHADAAPGPPALINRVNKQEQERNEQRMPDSICSERCLAVASQVLYNETKGVHNQLIGRAMELFAWYKHKVNPSVYLTKSLFKQHRGTARYV